MDTIIAREAIRDEQVAGASWPAAVEALAREVAAVRRRLAEIERLLRLLTPPDGCLACQRQPASARRDSRIVGSSPTPQPASPPARCPIRLTGRETEVLRLVAAGRSNREMAATLSVSERTIERHLENSYRKIGARNRADAVAFALRHRLA